MDVTVLVQCIADLFETAPGYFPVKFMNESTYSHRTGKISHLLNRLQHELLGISPTIILTIFFCQVNTVLQ